MQFVAEGYGTKRYAVMHNDFVILGSAKDPAGIMGMKDAAVAFKTIATAGAQFISRGDDSGTHTMEQSIWKATGVEMTEKSQEIVVEGKAKKIASSVPAGSEAWYVSIGQGMGKTITYAEEKQAYTLADRGTYIKYKYGKTPAVDLEIVCEGGDLLANPYGVIPVNPEKHAHVQVAMATEFAEWLVSARGQKLINDYQYEGKQLFFPDAIDSASLK
jgi:tungstate transport system substrate-binding protein